MKKFFYILFLIFFAAGQAQVMLEVKTAKKDYTENDNITVTISLEISGRDLVQETSLKMFDLSKFDVITNGSNRNTFIDQKTGVFVDHKFYQFVLRPKKPGRIKIGSASVVVNEKLYYTEPFDIFVAPSEKKMADNDANDVFLNVELKEAEVYENQPTVAVLKAFSRNIHNFRKVRNIRLPQHDYANILPVSFAKSDIEPSLDNAASQVLAVYLIYPKEAGKLQLSPVSANISSKKNTIVSNKVNLRVKELPEDAPDHFKNAVGKFKVQLSHNAKGKAELEKPILVDVKISGVGNFENLEIPEISKSVDYTFFPPKITKNTTVNETGIKGEIIASYVVIPKKTGKLDIQAERFSFFDPSKQRYVDAGKQMVSLEVFTHSEILSSRTPLERMNEYSNTVLETVASPVVNTEVLKVKEHNSIKWSTVLLNTLIFLTVIVLFFLFRYFQKTNKKNENISTLPPVTTVQEKEQEIKSNLKADINDYFYYLKKLHHEQEYDLFFQTVEEMDQEVRNQYFQNSEQDFKIFLEKHQGPQTADEYRKLKQQIQIEKFAPLHDEEGMDALMEALIKLYSKISK